MSIASNFPAIKPSLNLDFANTKMLDSRVTFTRASTGTYYNGVTTALAEQNLLTYSQEFDNGAWTPARATVSANSTVAPDGTTTADTLTEDGTAANTHQIAQTRAVGTGTAVGSVYVKNASGTRLVLVAIDDGTSANSSYAVVNPVSGAVFSGPTNAGTFTGGAVSVTTVGAWFRIAITGTGLVQRFRISLTDAAGNVSYNGDGTSGIFIWGAQVEQRSTVTAYTATTTQAITNYIPVLLTAQSGVPRFDHNPTTDESLGLLIEESRTNLVLYSEQFDNAAWSKQTGGSITANTVVAPDGTITADAYTWATSSSGFAFLLQTVSGNATNPHTYSVWLKRPIGSGDRSLRLTISDVSLSTGNSSNIVVTESWQRFTFTRTSANNTGSIGVGLNTASGTPTPIGIAAGDVLHVWGAQLEAGAFATSYIQTVAATVTRAADAASMTGTNFSSWYNAGEGTLYAEASVFDTGLAGIVSVNDASANNVFQIFKNGTANNYEVVSGGVTQASPSGATSSLNLMTKRAAVLKANDFIQCVNGTLSSADTSGILPGASTQLQIGDINGGSAFKLNGHINKVSYYPMRVTNAQLQSLTS